MTLSNIAALLAEIGPARPRPATPRVGKYADLIEAQQFVLRAVADGYQSVCVPESLYAQFGQAVQPGRSVWAVGGVRLVEDGYLREGELVALPGGTP